MGSVVHGDSHGAIKHFRKESAAMAVYWIYLARANEDNVAFPSLRGLVKDTGWSINKCKTAREWLVEHKALELVPGYMRPKWRELSDADRTRKVNYDKAEYYRPTGKIVFDDQTFPMLYSGGSTDSDIDEPEPDISQNDTSDSKPDISQNDTPGSADTAPDVSQNDTPDKPEIAASDVSPQATSDSTLTELNTSNDLELDSKVPDLDLGISSSGKATTAYGAINRFTSILGNFPSSTDRESILADVKEYGLEKINTALDTAQQRKEQGKFIRTWRYVEPILNDLVLLEKQPPPGSGAPSPNGDPPFQGTKSGPRRLADEQLAREKQEALKDAANQ